MLIPPSLMKERRSAYAVYTKRMEEEKSRKEKDTQQNAKLTKKDHDTQNIPKELKSRKRSCSEVHKTITKKQATQEEELCTAKRVFHEANQ